MILVPHPNCGHKLFQRSVERAELLEKNVNNISEFEGFSFPLNLPVPK